MVFFSKKINFDVVFWPCLSHCRPFLTLFRPQIEVGFFSSHRDTRPPGLVKDHTFFGFFFCTLPLYWCVFVKMLSKKWCTNWYFWRNTVKICRNIHIYKFVQIFILGSGLSELVLCNCNMTRGSRRCTRVQRPDKMQTIERGGRWHQLFGGEPISNERKEWEWTPTHCGRYGLGSYTSYTSRRKWEPKISCHFFL